MNWMCCLLFFPLVAQVATYRSEDITQVKSPSDEQPDVRFNDVRNINDVETPGITYHFPRKRRRYEIQRLRRRLHSQHFWWHKRHRAQSRRRHKKRRKEIDFRKTFLKTREELRKIRKLEYSKINQCQVPARKHDSETIALINDVYKRLQYGLTTFVYKDGDKCYKERTFNYRGESNRVHVKEWKMRRSIQRQFGKGARLESIGCIPKGTVQSGTLNMCNECVYRLTLPDVFVEREHKIHLCDNKPKDEYIDDYSCFMGEGTCMEVEITRNLLKQTSGSTKVEVVPFTFTIGCSCQIRVKSSFSAFVG